MSRHDQPRRTVSTARLVRRLIGYRRAASALLVAAGILLSLSVVALALAGRSADLAARSAVAADLGGRAYAVTARTEDSVGRLSADQRFVPIVDREGRISLGNSQMPSAVRITPTAHPLPLGVLVAGRHPVKAGEATASRSIARSLGLHIGDQVRLHDIPGQGDVRIVGLVADPSNAFAATVNLVGEVDVEEAGVWVSRTDPYAISALRPLFDARVLTYQSLDSIEDARVRQLPSAVGLLRQLPIPVGGVLAVLLGSVVISFRRIAQRDYNALCAAGMSARRAYRIIVGTATGLILAGQILGSMAAVALAWLFRSSVSAQLGQDWVAVAVPWATGVEQAALVLIAALLIRRGTRLGRRASLVSDRLAERLGGVGPGAVLGVVGLALLGIAAAARTQSPPGQLVRVAPIGAVAMVVAVAILARLIVSSRLRPGTKALMRALTRHVVVVAALGGIIAVGGAAYAATATRDANGFSTLTRAPQPPGSLLMTEVPRAAATTIVEGYRQLGGVGAQRFTLPVEEKSQLRVTGTKLVGCMESANIKDPGRAPDDCFPQRTMSPIATVAFSQTESPRGENKADPGLLARGEVGLLAFAVGSPLTTRLAITNAKSDEALGGNMPGLVIPVDGKVAEAFDLRPGKTELVALTRFSDLTGPQQARLRSIIARVAPAAQIADATQRHGYDLDRSMATVVAIVGAGLVVLVTLGGTTAVLAGHRTTRRSLVDIGAGPRPRRRLALLWASVLFVTYGGSIALAGLSARLAGINIDASYGWIWLLPGVAGFVATIGFLVGCTRVPSRVA